jgi:hypothetical protein
MNEIDISRAGKGRLSRSSTLIPLAASGNSGILQGDFEPLALALDPEAPGEERNYLH